MARRFPVDEQPRTRNLLIHSGAVILLAASVFHFQMIDISELKDYLRGRGVDLR